MYNFKKQSFTLAETLVVLAIIGVVASLTIPSVIQNYKKHSASVRLKKFYSIMNNAITLAEIEQNQKVEDWDYSLDSITFFNKYLSKHINCKIGKGVNEKSYHPGYGWIQSTSNSWLRDACYFTDGTSMVFAVGKSRAFPMSYDVNGTKSPNKRGIDQFDFVFGNKDINCPYKPTPLGHNNIDDNHACYIVYLIKTGAPNAPTLQDEYNKCKSEIWPCTLYLFLKNFDFKDYPHKL